MKRLLTSLVAGALLLAVTGFAAEEIKLDGVTCPVSDKKVVVEQHLKYKEGQVFFCCPNCPGAFKEKTAKFAEKANIQLVSTGQYKQKACPLTGKPVTAKVEKTEKSPEIGFCCKNCLAKYNEANEAAKLKLVFADAAFEKGFEPKKEEKKAN